MKKTRAQRWVSAKKEALYQIHILTQMYRAALKIIEKRNTPTDISFLSLSDLYPGSPCIITKEVDSREGDIKSKIACVLPFKYPSEKVHELIHTNEPWDISLRELEQSLENSKKFATSVDELIKKYDQAIECLHIRDSITSTKWSKEKTDEIAVFNINGAQLEFEKQHNIFIGKVIAARKQLAIKYPNNRVTN